MADNNQPVVGIAGIQAAARSSGSTTRAGSKKFFLLAIRWAPLIGLALALAFLWRDYATKTPLPKSDAPTATTSTQPMRAEVKWGQREADGSLPVGVWSEYFAVTGGKTVELTSGNGVLYKMCFKWEHEKDEDCRIHTPGTNAQGAMFKYMILEAGKGMKSAPVTVL